MPAWFAPSSGGYSAPCATCGQRNNGDCGHARPPHGLPPKIAAVAKTDNAAYVANLEGRVRNLEAENKILRRNLRLVRETLADMRGEK